MLTFKQSVAELAQEDVLISRDDIEAMNRRFGEKVLPMGHVNEDGSMNVPVDCIVEASRGLEAVWTIAIDSCPISTGEAFPKQVREHLQERVKSRSITEVRI
jgi:copper homeostasis protein CutC